MEAEREEIEPSKAGLGAEAVPLRGAPERRAEDERIARLRRVVPARFRGGLIARLFARRRPLR